MGWVEGFEPSATGTTIRIGEYRLTTLGHPISYLQRVSDGQRRPEVRYEGHILGHTGTLLGTLRWGDPLR
jgi:hypothetical protein